GGDSGEENLPPGHGNANHGRPIAPKNENAGAGGSWKRERATRGLLRARSSRTSSHRPRAPLAISRVLTVYGATGGVTRSACRRTRPFAGTSGSGDTCFGPTHRLQRLPQLNGCHPRPVNAQPARFPPAAGLGAQAGRARPTAQGSGAGLTARS